MVQGAGCGDSVAMTQNHSTLGTSALGQRMLPWHRLALPEPTPTWLQVAGAVLIVVMLACFYRVVNASAQHAQRQHRVDTAQADARAYCRTLPDARDRDSCAVRLGVAPADDDTP